MTTLSRIPTPTGVLLALLFSPLPATANLIGLQDVTGQFMAEFATGQMITVDLGPVTVEQDMANPEFVVDLQGADFILDIDDDIFWFVQTDPVNGLIGAGFWLFVDWQGEMGTPFLFPDPNQPGLPPGFSAFYANGMLHIEWFDPNNPQPPGPMPPGPWLEAHFVLDHVPEPVPVLLLLMGVPLMLARQRLAVRA
ncbi:MAG: hypothetical protein KJO38_05470 [Gammaproteobacteria bacterium]|nr:hypothetical protein [Gammaproteobacteria bacterium]